nr:MAG TPA: hypothetical protein [Caudoviricetes sp.]
MSFTSFRMLDTDSITSSICQNANSYLFDYLFMRGNRFVFKFNHHVESPFYMNLTFFFVDLLVHSR